MVMMMTMMMMIMMVMMGAKCLSERVLHGLTPVWEGADRWGQDDGPAKVCPLVSDDARMRARESSRGDRD